MTILEHAGSEPLRVVPDEASMGGESAVDVMRRVVESLVSFSHLRGHAFDDDKLDGSNDPASPAAILAAMDEHLTVPVSYIVALPPVHAALPRGCAGRSAMELVTTAAQTSQKIVVYSTTKGTCLGPFPQASFHSRCRLNLKGADSTVTLAHIQRSVPRCAIFHFRRVSEDAVNVTFENARSAKEAFVALQGKSLGGCDSVQVKMHLECGKQLQRIQQPCCHFQEHTVGRTDGGSGGAALSVPPVSPIDVCVMLTNDDKTPFDSLTWTRNSNRNTVFQQSPQSRDGCAAWAGGGRLQDNCSGVLGEALAEQVSYDMHMATMHKYMMTPSNGTAACRTPWDTNEAVPTRSPLTARLPAPGNRGDNMRFLDLNSSSLMYGEGSNNSVTGETHEMHKSSPDMWSLLGSLDAQPYAHYRGGSMPVLPRAGLPSPPETVCSIPSRRLQHDPYKGGIYVEAPEMAHDSKALLTPPEPPQCLLQRKSLFLDLLGNSRTALDSPFSFHRSDKQLKKTSSTTNDDSMPCLTLAGTSGGESCGFEKGVSHCVEFPHVVGGTCMLEPCMGGPAKV